MLFTFLNRSKLEAKRLETQWKKICDHEKRSKERNKELLKDFERVEQHAALLAVKTERLKAYKVTLTSSVVLFLYFLVGLVSESEFQGQEPICNPVNYNCNIEITVFMPLANLSSSLIQTGGLNTIEL